MHRSAEQLRSDALSIWHAGVAAVRSDVLVRAAMRVDGQRLVIEGESIDLAAVDRIVVVGAGKAGAGMAAAVEEVFGPQWLENGRLDGWVNVPADCVRPLERIHLHAGRPPGVNEPRPEGAAGANEILRLVRSAGPRDLVLCLISGGGSALLPAPADGITLDDKLAVTRLLSAAGATIDELNTVRKQLSRIKGGGLARACRAGRLVSLIISDVLGDPLNLIASGPTVPDDSTPEQALEILTRFGARKGGISPGVFALLESKSKQPHQEPSGCRVNNAIIGNNARAVDAAGTRAEQLGYSHAMVSATRSEGLAEDVGRHLADMAVRMRDQAGPNCLISGGEPVVQLAETSHRGKGGRNQQLVLAALERLWEDGAHSIVVLSGGTDGEDGPTDAAGAWFDAELLAAAKEKQLRPAEYLARNDAYHFFEPLEGLIVTGPTHTNVCDLRVVLVDRE
ncbi:MAG: glycerate kinase type-2 family protein [Planctomycetota bacterium]